MKNLEIRQKIQVEGLKLWQVAYAIGINDSNFSRKLRHELSESEKVTCQQKTVQLIAFPSCHCSGVK